MTLHRFLREFAKLALLAMGLLAMWLGATGEVPASPLHVDTSWLRMVFVVVGLVILALRNAPPSLVEEQQNDSHSSKINNQELTGKAKQGVARPWESPLLFFITFFFAVFVELEVLPRASESRYRGLGEHLVVALLIASILGLTYEYFLSRRREKQLKRLFRKHRNIFKRENQNLLDIFMKVIQLQSAATPEMVLRMLRDAAEQIKEIPTLYEPARDKGNECTFAANLDYFNLAMSFRRDEFVEVIKGWILDRNCPANVRFLASDFVGKFQIGELADLLQHKAEAQLSHWGDITDETEKSWILNYLWAASRCDLPIKYVRLTEFLCSRADEWAQKWILYVPLQMKEPELVSMIESYLQSPIRISEANLKNVIRALVALEVGDLCNAGDMAVRYAQRFRTPELREAIEIAFGKRIPPVEPGEAA